LLQAARPLSRRIVYSKIMSIFGSLFKKNLAQIQPDKWHVGDKISGRYEIHQVLGGEGKTGMGIVYVCYDHEHETPYVLKTFQDKFLKDASVRNLFEQEALTWIKLEKYPYIVRAHWVEKIEGRLFIVLEYIPQDPSGRNTLSHYLGNLTFPEILKLAIQFCYGMEYACLKGISAHRDIKPDNIMITQDKTVKITDFGLAKAFQEMQLKENILSCDSNTSVSIFKNKGKQICGTLPYMAPEQFDGYADVRSDIYSFGITLYQMVNAGNFPFIARSQQEYERLHRHDKVPHLSTPLRHIIERCLEKNPNNRYQNFISLQKRLQEFLLKETGESIPLPAKEKLESHEFSNKGLALNALGRSKEAIVCYDEAIAIDPKEILAWYNKGNALLELCRYQEALNCYDEAIKINPNDADSWSNKAPAFNLLGRNQEAISCCSEAIRINPKHVFAWTNKGIYLSILGRNQEAIACYNKALEINPKYSKALHNKGVALNNLGNHKDAFAYFNEAIKANPRDSEAWCNKGAALFNQGKLNEAIACYDKAIEAYSRESLAWCNKGLALRELGKPQEAIFCYDKALEINPKDTKTWNSKAVALFDLGKYSEAIVCCNQVIELEPMDKTAWYNKGLALGSLGKHEEEIACYDKAIEADPENEYVHFAWNNKGSSLMGLGKYEEAIKCFEKCLKINPSYALAENNRKMCLKKLRS